MFSATGRAFARVPWRTGRGNGSQLLGRVPASSRSRHRDALRKRVGVALAKERGRTSEGGPCHRKRRPACRPMQGALNVFKSRSSRSARGCACRLSSGSKRGFPDAYAGANLQGWVRVRRVPRERNAMTRLLSFIPIVDKSNTRLGRIMGLGRYPCRRRQRANSQDFQHVFQLVLLSAGRAWNFRVIFSALSAIA